MTVKVAPNIDRSQLTHNVSICAPGEAPIGLIYNDRPMERIPVSPPPQEFAEAQSSWTGGRGRLKLRDDPFAYWDSKDFWGMTDQKGFPVPQWRFATGFRTAVGTLQTGSVTWKALYGTVNRYIAVQVEAITAADKGMLLLRRVGSPGTLTFQLANDHATPGKPGTSIANTTVTKTISNITDYVSVYELFDWTSTQNLLATDWLYIFGASGDTAENHWEVAVNASGTGSKVSANGSTWTTPSPDFAMYYRVMDADVARRLLFFPHENAQYVISVNADNSVSKIWINGERGELSASSAAGATTVTDSTKGCAGAWAANLRAGERIRFVGGTGAFQRDYAITASTTGGEMTISPALERAVDNSTRYVTYGGPGFTELTVPGGATGITVSVTCRPVSANKVVYLCQGTSLNVKRFHENDASTSNHEWADTAGTFQYDIFEIHPATQTGLKIWAANAILSTVYSASPPAWGGAASFTAIKGAGQVGATDARITSIKSGSKKLYVGKEDGLWIVEETTATQLGIGAIKDWTTPQNCSVLTAPDENQVYFGYGNSLGKLTGTQFSDLLGFRAGYDGLPENRKGYVSGLITAGGWVMFSIDAGTSGYSGVYVWNGMGIMELWRGWATGVRVRDIFWQPCPGTRGKLWIDANGEPVYIDFPLDHTNPLLDASLNFQHEFVLVSGVIDVGKEDFYKLVHEIKVMSQNLSVGSRWIEVDYQVNANVGTTTWQPWGEINQSPADTRILDLGEVFKIQVRFRGYTTSSTTPPIITLYDVKGRIAEPAKFMWLGSFRVGGNPPRNLKNETDLPASEKLERIIGYASKQTKLTMNADRAEDDNRIATAFIPADTPLSIQKNTWSGVIQMKFTEC